MPSERYQRILGMGVGCSGGSGALAYLLFARSRPIHLLHERVDPRFIPFDGRSGEIARFEGTRSVRRGDRRGLTSRFVVPVSTAVHRWGSEVSAVIEMTLCRGR